MEASEAIEGRLAIARARVTANKTLFSERGLDSGVLREIDISDVPPNEAQPVLDRYGIKIVLMPISDKHPQGINFLQRARTREGMYVRRQGSGLFQAFTYGAPAVARMMQLESDAIGKRGRDPKQTRIIRVVFGVVYTTKGYDLGIKHIEMEPVPGLEDDGDGQGKSNQ